MIEKSSFIRFLVCLAFFKEEMKVKETLMWRKNCELYYEFFTDSTMFNALLL